MGMAPRVGDGPRVVFDRADRPFPVTAIGTGVDGAVRRLETAYDTQGNAYQFTSYDAPSGGDVVNQVQDVFNGLGQLTAEYQEHLGVVANRRGVARWVGDGPRLAEAVGVRVGGS
jgi:hypothetical protein